VFYVFFWTGGEVIFFYGFFELHLFIVSFSPRDSSPVHIEPIWSKIVKNWSVGQDHPNKLSD